MRRFYSWFGPGRGYDRPDNGDVLSTPNMWGRQDSSPTGAFRFKQGPSTITAQGGQNAGDNRVQWGATETADDIARRENFKF